MSRGGPVRVLVVGPRHPGPRSRGGMATVVGLMRSQHDDRVAVTTLSTYVDDRAAVRWAVALVGLARAVVLIAGGRVDVVHVHLAHGGSVLRKAVPLLAARARGVPAVVHAHSFDFAAWYDAQPHRRRALVRRLLPAQQWLVLGEGLVAPYRDRLGLPPDSIRALHNPAPPVRATGPGTDGPVGGPVRAVTLGRLGRRKGSLDLLDALDRLGPAARASLRLVMAGDGEVEEVRAEIERRGLADVVEARGWQAPPERDALLDAAEVFVLPSHAEGLPMAMLEAMAAGLVPVVTDVGVVAEVAHDGLDAIVVPPGDPAALAAALESLVLDPERRARLAAAARAEAGRRGVSGWFEELVELWTGLAATGRGPRPR